MNRHVVFDADESFHRATAAAMLTKRIDRYIDYFGSGGARRPALVAVDRRPWPSAAHVGRPLQLVRTARRRAHPHRASGAPR